MPWPGDSKEAFAVGLQVKLPPVYIHEVPSGLIPTSVHYHSPEQDFTFLGNFLIDAGQYVNAAVLLTQAINSSFGKNDYDLISSAASAYRQATLYDKAEEYYKKAVKLKPNVSCYLRYSNFLTFLQTLKYCDFYQSIFTLFFNCF